MDNFKKYMGIYATNSDLETALDSQALRIPYVALVGADQDVEYPDVRWLIMYQDGTAGPVIPKAASANTWSIYSTTVNVGDVISFAKAARSTNGTGFTPRGEITFRVDGTDYTTYTAATNMTNLVITLQGGVFTLNYTDLGTFDVRITNNDVNYDLTFGASATSVNQALGSSIESDKAVDYWYVNGTSKGTEYSGYHIDKEDIVGSPLGDYTLVSLRAERTGTSISVYIEYQAANTGGGTSSGGDEEEGGFFIP